MITKERLMELLVQTGEEIGILPKRMPAGWQRFAELVEKEVRENLKDVTHIIIPRTLPPLEEAWRRYYDKGYRYGNDAMEQVRLGYRIAREELERAQSPVVQCSHPSEFVTHVVDGSGTPVDHCNACGKNLIA